MRAKIGDTWFDAGSAPICVELTDDDKARIRDMPKNCDKYAAFPGVSDTAHIEAWMKDDATDRTQPTEGA